MEGSPSKREGEPQQVGGVCCGGKGSGEGQCSVALRRALRRCTRLVMPFSEA